MSQQPLIGALRMFQNFHTYSASVIECWPIFCQWKFNNNICSIAHATLVVIITWRKGCHA
jgi:hypothetical protein